MARRSLKYTTPSGAASRASTARGWGGGFSPPPRRARLWPPPGVPRAGRGPAPPVVPARQHQVDLVVAGRPVLGLPQPARLRVESEPERVAMADRERPPPGEGVVGRARAVLLHPEHLPRRVTDPLRPRRHAGVSGDGVQPAVRAEVDRAAVVKGGRRDRGQDLPLQPAGALAQPNDAVPLGAPLGVVGEHPLFAGLPLRVEGDPQDALLADAGDVLDLRPAGVAP